MLERAQGHLSNQASRILLFIARGVVVALVGALALAVVFVLVYDHVPVVLLVFLYWFLFLLLLSLSLPRLVL